MPWRSFPLLLLLLLLSSCSLVGSGGGASVVVSFVGNLDVREPVRDDPFLADEPGKSAQLSATVQVPARDLGNYPLSIYFRKEGMSLFAFYVMAVIEPAPGAPLSQGEDAAKATLVGQGRLRFDTDGALLSFSPDEPIQVQFRGAASSEKIGFDFGAAKEDGGDGLSGFTQYALKTSITHQAVQ